MKKEILQSWYLFLPAATWMGVIFILSNQPVLPGLEVVWQDFIFKKLAHFGVYLVLFLCWWWAWRKIEDKSDKIFYAKWWLIPLLCLLFALSDEWHQSFVPGRTCRLYDVGIDMLGVITGWLWVYKKI